MFYHVRVPNKDTFQSAVEFRDAIHPSLQKCEARTKHRYMDDVKLEGQVQVVASDVQAIIDAYSEIGLGLNPSKCELLEF